MRRASRRAWATVSKNLRRPRRSGLRGGIAYVACFWPAIRVSKLRTAHGPHRIGGHADGISRSRVYELIQSGDLQTVKVGRSTLILYKSLKALTGA